MPVQVLPVVLDAQRVLADEVGPKRLEEPRPLRIGPRPGLPRADDAVIGSDADEAVGAALEPAPGCDEVDLDIFDEHRSCPPMGSLPARGRNVSEHAVRIEQSGADVIAGGRA